MAVIRLYMSMPVDGYVAGPNDSFADPMGIGGVRVFDWLDRRNDPGPSGQVYGEALATRAVLSGRRTCEHALLHAGQLDELELHLVPAMLGQGRRFGFNSLAQK